MTLEVNTQQKQNNTTQNVADDNTQLFAQATLQPIKSTMPAKFEERFGTQYQNLGTVSSDAKTAIEAVFGFKPWLNEKGEEIKGALDYGDIKDIGKVMAEYQNTPLNTFGGASGLGDDNKTYSFVNSETLESDGALYGYKPGEYTKRMGEQEVVHEMFNANFPDDMVIGADGKPRFSDSHILKNEVVGDAASVKTDNKYNQILLTQYFQSVSNPNSVSGNYALSINVTERALDKLAKQYNLKDTFTDQNGNQTNLDGVSALYLKYINHHNSDGVFNAKDLTTKGIKDFAKNGLKVDPDQFYADFNKTMEDEYLTAASEIIKQEKKKKEARLTS